MPYPTTTRRHEKWMHAALELAWKGRFRTSPNPMVGACLLRGKRLVGKGYHERYGGPHAEIAALKKAGLRARRATLYVTLEPCASWGKTPPCVSAIVQAGVREVVIGSLDPNPVNHGKGVQALRREGIRVLTGILAGEVEKQNASFFKWVRTRMPFVTLKMAQTLDGKIATCKGHSRWISSKASRDFVHRLRAEQDAILIGKNTLLQDNPRLSPARTNFRGQEGKPWRVALDPHLEVRAGARIFSGQNLTLLAVSEKRMKDIKQWKGRGGACSFLAIPEKKGALDLGVLLKKLASLGVAKLLVEGGGELAWSLIRAGFVDKFYWIVAPKIIGGRQAKTSVEGPGVCFPSEAFPLKIIKTERLGGDWLFEGELK